MVAEAYRLNTVQNSALGFLINIYTKTFHSRKRLKNQTA